MTVHAPLSIISRHASSEAAFSHRRYPIHRKLALNLEDLSVESTDVVFDLEYADYAESVLIRTNTEPCPERTSPTHCCA